MNLEKRWEAKYVMQFLILKQLYKDFTCELLLQKYGELAQVEADGAGRASFRFENDHVKVWDIIGRSMVLQSVGQRLDSNLLY